MSKRMLIDGNYEEEIRVVIASGSQLEEYDIQTSFRKQIKSNIYLATVARVEPSLQAAFVDYGGDRHGFLPFNDVHPDYYQIPVEDRRKLLEEQEALDHGARAAREHLEEIDGDSASDDLEVEQDDGPAVEAAEPDGPAPEEDEDEDQAPDTELADADADADEGEAESAPVETVEETAPAGPNRRRYKIQEVIKPGQILLVQILKEERGNKGAALTTYISLPGRYCVLMPNASRTGGISRRITDSGERKKLRKTLSALDVPDGMGLIIRTAGMQRSKSEIKRDLDYLLRAWDEVREVTMSSTAPCLVYEEGDIIKRSIRDVYAKDIETVLVDGDDVYKSTKRFMRLMMPSHAKRVQRYDDGGVSLFQRHQIEQQLEAMYRPGVGLKSGGSLVINQTEALVAIDVNSGKSTSERNTERTALKTNLEAAEEVARQLRLRDLAGLIVIDFIDMDESRNVRKVERRMREVVKDDRARLKMGRISEFGLMELSRQRLRPSLIESSGEICRHCEGTGYVLSVESMALRVLRAIEQEAARRRQEGIVVFVPTGVALYILNQKRARLVEIENRHELRIVLRTDDSGAPDVRIEQMVAEDGTKKAAPSGKRQASRKRQAPAKRANGAAASAEESADGGRRQGRKRGRRRRNEAEPAKDEQVAGESLTEANGAAVREEEPADGGRRSGRKRGRRRKSETEAPVDEQAASEVEPASESVDAVDGSGDESEKQPAARRRRRRRRRKAANGEAQPDALPAADGPPPANGDAANIDAGGAMAPEGHPQPAGAAVPEPLPPQLATDYQPEPQGQVEDAGTRDEDVEKAARRGWWQKAAG